MGRAARGHAVTGDHRPDPPSSSTSSPAANVVLLGVILVIALIGAGVALGIAGWKPESIVGMLSGLGGVAGGLLVAVSKLATLNDKVDKVAHQTDGALRSFVSTEVSTQVRSALADHGLPSKVVPPRPHPRSRVRGGKD